ncbi:gamma-glutamylcyclotransferase, partial [Amycolatopsis halotolerans]
MHLDGAGHALDTAPPGWRSRTPVLAYGSNACPSKITWLRTELGLTG